MDLIQKYIKLFFDLLPMGKAWTRDVGTVLYKVVRAFSVEFSRIEARALQLLTETDPSRTSELLTDFERELNLPDDCSPVGTLTVQQRQAQVLEKITRLGGQSEAYIIQVAAALGYTITITSFKKGFLAGVGRAGDRLANGAWQSHFIVNAPLNSDFNFLAGSGRAGDPLGSFNNQLLECTIDKIKPANTTVSFNYA